jgi:hypothetical protein
MGTNFDPVGSNVSSSCGDLDRSQVDEPAECGGLEEQGRVPT